MTVEREGGLLAVNPRRGLSKAVTAKERPIGGRWRYDAAEPEPSGNKKNHGWDDRAGP